MVADVRAAGFEVPYLHMASSAASLLFPDYFGALSFGPTSLPWVEAVAAPLLAAPLFFLASQRAWKRYKLAIEYNFNLIGGRPQCQPD